MKILFKSCPKCETGDLVKYADMYGAYFECMQCGFSRDVVERQFAAARPIAVLEIAPVLELRSA